MYQKFKKLHKKARKTWHSGGEELCQVKKRVEDHVVELVGIYTQSLFYPGWQRANRN